MRLGGSKLCRVCRVSCCSASLDGLGLLAHVLPSPQLLQKRNAKECNELLKSYLYLWVRECKPPEASFLCVSSIFKRRQGVTSCLSVFHSGQCNCIRNGAERPLEPPQPDSLVCVCQCSPVLCITRSNLVPSCYIYYSGVESQVTTTNWERRIAFCVQIRMTFCQSE